MTVQEAMKVFHVSDQTLINWWRDGLFPNAYKANPTKKNSKLLIPIKDIEQVRASQRKAARG